MAGELLVKILPEKSARSVRDLGHGYVSEKKIHFSQTKIFQKKFIKKTNFDEKFTKKVITKLPLKHAVEGLHVCQPGLVATAKD